MDWPAWITQGLAALGVGVGVYAGIRADLARLNERATNALESARQAHARIDGVLGAHR